MSVQAAHLLTRHAPPRSRVALRELAIDLACLAVALVLAALLCSAIVSSAVLAGSAPQRLRVGGPIAAAPPGAAVQSGIALASR